MTANKGPADTTATSVNDLLKSEGYLRTSTMVELLATEGAKVWETFNEAERRSFMIYIEASLHRAKENNPVAGMFYYDMIKRFEKTGSPVKFEVIDEVSS